MGACLSCLGLSSGRDVSSLPPLSLSSRSRADNQTSQESESDPLLHQDANAQNYGGLGLDSHNNYNLANGVGGPGSGTPNGQDPAAAQKERELLEGIVSRATG
jgi:hypothetical protein